VLKKLYDDFDNSNDGKKLLRLIFRAPKKNGILDVSAIANSFIHSIMKDSGGVSLLGISEDIGKNMMIHY
jgi:hypothetical protein